jgi:hypothetical protein
MTHRRCIRRLATTLSSLSAALLALVTASPAAFAMPWPVPGSHPAPGQPSAQVHTIATGGMPGWQIILIAVGAAILVAAAAVLLDRAWTARRHPTVPTA